LLTQYLDIYLDARELGLFDVQRTKAIESLAHAAERSIDAMTVAEIKTSKFKSQEEIDQWFQRFSMRVQRSITEFGDPKLQNTGEHATEFVDGVLEESKTLPVNGVLKINDFLRGFGVRPDQVNDKTTVWEIGQVAIFNAQMKLLAENGNIRHDEVFRVNPKRVPSWIIWRELNEKMKADYRATGSSMSDRYHSSFISYVDKFQCDKRVHHYLGISKSTSEPIIRAKTISFKVKDYSSLSFG